MSVWKKALLAALVVTAFALLAGSHAAAQTGWAWTIEDVDQLGDVGHCTSIMVLDCGTSCISYCDATNGHLRFAWREDAGWQVKEVDLGPGVGMYTHLARFPADHPTLAGEPCIAYYDTTNGDLRFAWHEGGEFDSNWYVTTVDSLGDVGQFNDLAFVNGTPGISYYDATAERLKYAELRAGGWVTYGVPSAMSGVGQYTSLVELPTGQPGISYYDYTHGDLRFAWRDGASVWRTALVDAVGDVGQYGSAVLLPSNHPRYQNEPAIAYHDATGGSLKFAWHNGTDYAVNWHRQVVDSQGDTGMHIGLALRHNGQPAISYYVGNAYGLRSIPGYDLRYAEYTWKVDDEAFYAQRWSTWTVDWQLVVGEWTSLAFCQGVPVISYHYGSGSDLRYARGVFRIVPDGDTTEYMPDGGLGPEDPMPTDQGENEAVP